MAGWFRAHVVRVALCAALAWCVARPVRADGDVELAARTAFEAGLEAAKAEDFPRARSLFVRSRELVPKPSTLLNLAVVDLELGLSDEAMSVLDELLRIAQGPDYERMRERAERLRGEAQALHDAQVGSALGPLGRVTAPPSEPPPEPPRTVVGSPLPAPSIPARAAPLAAPPTMSKQRGARALIGSGAALALVSLATGAGWWRDRNHALDRCSRSDGVICPQEDQIRAQRTVSVVTTLGLGAAAFGLGLGGGLWLAKLKREGSPRPLALAPCGAGLALAGVF